jgi:hypothetical protein
LLKVLLDTRDQNPINHPTNPTENEKTYIRNDKKAVESVTGSDTKGDTYSQEVYNVYKVLKQDSGIWCQYCDILGYDRIPYSDMDSLERHTIQKHPGGWTAYPGPADLERFKQVLDERGQS